MQEKFSGVISQNVDKKQLLVNFILLLVPLTYIIGTLALNLNIAIFILVCLFFFLKDILKLKFSFIDKIVFLFFFFILFTGLFNTIEKYYFSNIEKDDNFLILLKKL